MKPVRVLVLVHKHLVPPDTATAEELHHGRLEDGVGRHLDAAGKRQHELRVIGVERRPVADPPGHRRLQADHRLQPDGGVRRHRRLRSERRQLPGAAAGAVHRLQPARADAVARQGPGQEADGLPPHSGAGLRGRAARPQGQAAQAPGVPADRQVAHLRVVDRHLAGVGGGERGPAAEARAVHPRHHRHGGHRRAVHRRPRAVRGRARATSGCGSSRCGRCRSRRCPRTPGTSPPSG